METQNNSSQNPEQNNQAGQSQEGGQAENQTANNQNSQQQNQTGNAQQQQAPLASSNDVEENKAITFLSYLGLLFLVPMLVKKDSPFAQFHSKQGLVLTVAWFVGGFLYPLLGLGLLVHIALLVFSIMGLINVNNGEMKDLPVVGDLAKKFNI